MRVERTLVGLLLAALVAAPGCGRLAYNLPPSSRLMEPGPGVGGPGPGVIPPVGGNYGMYGGAVGRFGDGQGGYMGGGGGCGPCAQMGPGGPMGPGGMGPGGMGPGGMSAGMMGPGGPMGPGNAVPCPTPGGGIAQAGYNGPCGDGACTCGCNEGGACGCGPEGCGIQNCGFCPLGGGCAGGGCMGGCMGGPGSSEAYADGAGGGGFGMATSQIAFLGSEGVQVSWDVSGSGMFDSTALVIPGRQDFYQGAIYRLKVTNIPGRAGVSLYPTLEVAPVTPRTDAYLAHSPIPVQFTEEDFDQVTSGNFVTKVIYLPDPEFQELALAGVETLVSTRLAPGVDPIAEADRRGSILAILRIGNKDIELNNGLTGDFDGTVVPASHTVPAVGTSSDGRATQAMYNETTDGSEPADSNIEQAQYCDSGSPPYGGGGYCGGGYGDGNMPMGMPMGMSGGGMSGGGMSPPPVPPNYVAGAPQWGMPITGTPIGLPGPPHIPLGTPAGLQKHVMTNHTRYRLPPPVAKVHMSVKQRPGLNYPRPVNNVSVNETQREPFRLLPGWLTGHHHNHGGANGDCGPYGPQYQ